ncbi:MAG TPA: ABC transporter permease [Longimicrobium sp.]|nr:ABC transporter permease [Longimicrobium sp.]
MTGLAAAAHGVSIAFDALSGNRVRALLTTAGMVIGVGTVMAMASVISGVRQVVTTELVPVGPDNFVVERFDVGELRLAELGTGKAPWAGAPALTLGEAEMLAALPAVRSATPIVRGTTTLRVGRSTLPGVEVEGAGDEWPDYRAGTFVWGRNFLPSEVGRSANVVVLSEGLAREVFGRDEPENATVWLSGMPFRVVGVYRARGNLLAGADDQWMAAPYSTVLKHLDADEEWMEVLVVPADGVTRAEAMNRVTAALRTSRGLRPMDASNFALTEQEGVRKLFDDATRMFFVVMLALSSIGLLVGGVGVVAIMTISVTERTREIGVRKALGATRRAILWQFLVETVTVTVVGGSVGIVLAGGGALLLARLTPVPAAVPLWSVVAGLAVSAGCGLVFGIAPANRAARLDPVEALRHQ